MATAGIAAVDVRRSFGSVHAVRGVTLEAQAGAVTGLVGPNGAGKTTLLLMLASLLAPDGGSIRIAGVDPVVDPAGARSRLGWMPDTLGAWSSLSVRETLETTGRLYDLDRAAAARRAQELIDEVGLRDLADAHARVLSRGQKQRLGLARALVHDPSVLLLDEPASGLDPQARVDLRSLLRRYAAAGKTILISSHVLSELEEVVDDAVYIVDGATVSADRVAVAAQRSRPWRIRVADTDARAIALPVATALGLDVARVRTDRRDVLVAFATESDAAAGLRALIGAGIPVAEFSAATGLLEHTFLDLGASDGARS
ncbi:ABC transporter ATP-binding protein [Microbacterium imperiale]|uniref:Multidrug ABC transporter ATP-binding protein n=1 Tax=Microbacterium imperiale TaxID=33884 RepID=A0A9W6M3M3_9MICO|nr:ABC transporter ATP-binding protein [Microbacterium imperiale]MBP2420397.1 ABC-type multidrug transport system ATPase subunit [Microbacterium imperiale]MDS0197745.1 ABC transporter ATP-binding protein [Microbacterium imperiale]BFE40739.1 ABC transporter ATP-binding protein [Microbacterium imperiale]GLJ80116.1 multidrug ABC transporter ATP-binding protein [Microbacterium imperiale]